MALQISSRWVKLAEWHFWPHDKAWLSIAVEAVDDEVCEGVVPQAFVDTWDLPSAGGLFADASDRGVVDAWIDVGVVASALPLVGYVD